MSTDTIVLTILGSSLAAVAIGTGIYYLAKKDKSSGKKNSNASTAAQRRDENNHAEASSSHGTGSESASMSRKQVKQGDDDTVSSNMKAFRSAMKSKPIRDLDSLFKSLNSQDKNKVIADTLNAIHNIYDPEELALTKMILFIFENGCLSPEINQAFNTRAEDLALNLNEIDFDNEIKMFASLSEDKQVEYINDVGIPIHSSNSNNKDLMKFYYSRFMKPKTSPRVHELIDRW